MISIRRDPFPFEAARDLLGIARALYGEARARGADDDRLRALAAAGADLRAAIALAEAHGPGTLGFSSAWARAERAAEALGTLVDALAPAEPMVRAALRRAQDAAYRRSSASAGAGAILLRQKAPPR